MHTKYEIAPTSSRLLLRRLKLNWRVPQIFAPFANLDIEIHEHAFKHGVRDYEIEQIFKSKIYKRKIYANKELRYQIIGEAFGRLIMLIAIPLGSGLKVLSARPAPEYKEIYEGKAK